MDHATFPHATTARHLIKISRSFDMLLYAANDAIMNAVKIAGPSFADIDYMDIDDATHARFHFFLTNKGYQGGKSNVNGRIVYRIKW